MRSIFRELYDEQDAHMVCFRELLKLVMNESLHVELDDELLPFVEQSDPSELSGVTFVLLTNDDLSNSHKWRDAKYSKPSIVDFTISDDITDLLKPQRPKIRKGECKTKLQRYIYPKTRWASRITICDPYLLQNEVNIRGSLNFLDYIDDHAPHLKVLRIVLPLRFYVKVKSTTDSGDNSEERQRLTGEDARIHQIQLMQSELMTHKIFAKLERFEIAWDSKDTNRFLSFGRDSKEFTLPFHRGVSVHFQYDKEGRMLQDFQISEQLNHEDSIKRIEYDYESID